MFRSTVFLAIVGPPYKVMDGQLPNTHRVPSLSIFGCFGKKKFTTIPKNTGKQKSPGMRDGGQG
jgi:hypothetical protein